MEKQIITLCGMHRSGTSLVMSWLEKSGIQLFDKVESNTGNRFGHFEDRQFCRLQGLAIKDKFPHSKGWLLEAPTPLSFTKEELEKAQALFQLRNTSSTTSWGWKDPRTIPFLWEWKKIIPELKVILLYRPYQEVLHSLLKRAKKSESPMLQIDQDQALDNWLFYNKMLLEFKSTFETDSILFSLEEVLHNNQVCFQLLQEKLKLDLHYLDIQQLFHTDALSQTVEYKISDIRKKECDILLQQLQQHSAKTA